MTRAFFISSFIAYQWKWVFTKSFSDWNESG